MKGKSIFQFVAALLFSMLAANSTVYAQQIEGLLIDRQTSEPLSGAQIVLAGTDQGTLTDPQGFFSLPNPKQVDSVRISMVGYADRTLPSQEVRGLIALEASTVELNKIVISATRDARARETVPVAISSLQPQIIEDAKATSADQLLNKVTGVFMNDLGNEQHMMAIRQPISTKSIFLYLEDGIPIRTSGVFNHNALLEMNLAATRSIEVIRGPYSSFYGSEAIGGAINFITARPSAIPVARLSLQGNNLGYRRSDLSLSNTFGKLGTYFSGYYAQRRNGFREHSDFDKIALTGKVDYNIDEKNIWRNSITLIDYKSDMTGSLDSANFFGQEYSSLHTFTHRSVSALRFKSALTHFWEGSNKTDVTFLLRQNSIRQNPSYRVRDDFSPWGNPNGDPNLAHGEVNDNSFRSLAGIVQHRQAFNFLGASLTAGGSMDYSPNSYVSNYISIRKSDAGIYESFTQQDSVLTDYRVGLLNLAGYAQGEISPTERLKLIAAIRYDHFRYGYDNNLDSTAFSGAPDATNTFGALTPKVGLTYRLHQGIGLFANYSRGFVPPQVGELYRGVKVPSLEAALFDNFEVGGWVNLIQNKLALDFAVYQLNGNNEIISVRLDNGDLENQNAGKTSHQGVEYGLNLMPLPGLSMRLSGSNATHKYMEYVERGVEFNGNEMAAAPNFIANAEAIWKPVFLKGFRIGLEWQHVGAYYMDAANTARYPGFDVFNFRTGYTWKGFEAWLNIMNVTDELYATRASRSRWGDSYNIGDPRTFNVGIGYKFQGKKK